MKLEPQRGSQLDYLQMGLGDNPQAITRMHNGRRAIADIFSKTFNEFANAPFESDRTRFDCDIVDIATFVGVNKESKETHS